METYGKHMDRFQTKPWGLKHPRPKRLWISHLQTKQVDVNINVSSENKVVDLANKNRKAPTPFSRKIVKSHLLGASTRLLSHDSIHGTLQPRWSQAMSHAHLAARLTPHCLAPALGNLVVGGLATQRLAPSDWLLCYLYSYGPLTRNFWTWG